MTAAVNTDYIPLTDFEKTLHGEKDKKWEADKMSASHSLFSYSAQTT